MDKHLKEDQPKKYYEYVFKNSIKSDFEISLNDKVLRVHKKVLAQQNPVFLDKFISQPEVTQVEILDLDSMAVAIFINYLYTGQLSDGDVSEDLFRVADKFLDFKLKNICREKFLKTLTFGNAAKRLLFFLYQGESQLLKETSVFIAKNFNDVKLRPDFNLVLAKKKAVDAVFNVFDECKIAVLTEDKHPTREKLIESAKKSDLTIKVQNYTFLGHKETLSTRNADLETMISASPSTNDVASLINIHDCDPKVFKIFLKFTYSQDVKKRNITKELMNVAYVYKNQKLLQICEDYLLSKVCKANAIELLVTSANVESKKLKEKASKIIVENYEEMKERDEFRLVTQNSEAVDAVFCQFRAIIDKFHNSVGSKWDTSSFVSTFALKVPVAGQVESESFDMKNVGWQINIFLKDAKSAHLGLNLECEDKNDSFEDTIQFTVVLVSSVGESHNVSRKRHNRTFLLTIGNRIWEWDKFVSLTDLHDETKGLMTNRTIKVNVYTKLIEFVLIE